MTTLAPSLPAMPARLRVLLFAWTALAAAFALSGVFETLPEPAVPVLIWGTVAIVLATALSSAPARRYLATADMRGAVLFHSVRAPIGVAFLWLGSIGELHPTFVDVAAWGDIAAGLAALPVVYLLSRRAPSARTALWAWNVFAALDILIVFITAQRVILFGPGLDAMVGMTRFPLSMLPVWIVPLVILTHVWIFIRLRRGTTLRQSQA